MKRIKDVLEERKKIVNTNVCYFNDKGEIVSKEEATNVIITEYDSDGKIINEIHANCESKKPNLKKGSIIEEER